MPYSREGQAVLFQTVLLHRGAAQVAAMMIEALKRIAKKEKRREGEVEQREEG